MKKYGENIDNPSIKICISKIEVELHLKSKQYIILSKFLESIGIKVTRDKYGENVPHLEITEVVLVHCNIANNDYHQDSSVLCTSVPTSEYQTIEVGIVNH